MKEAFYFSHDCDARYDSKILRLRRKYGWEGYGLFWAIIEKLRVEGDYTLESDYENIAFEMQADAEVIKSIVCDFGLFSFTETRDRFYSASLAKRMQKSQDIAQKRKDAAAKRWNKDAKVEDVNANAMQMQNNSNANRCKYKSKDKDIKETLSKEREKKSEPAERDSQALLSDSQNLKSETVQKTRTKFVPPDVDEVKSYISEKGYEVDAEAFVAFYTSKDWYVGRNKMKNWRAALVTWHKRPRSPDSCRSIQNYNNQNNTAYGTHIKSDSEGDARKAYIARMAAEAIAECNSRNS